MSDSSFNLIDEPWILVRDCNGTIREVSIGELFSQLESIREIVGELPTQAFAVFRTILAIVYRALEINTAEDWFEWYQDPQGAQEEILDYLGAMHDRFDLRHPEYPFYQVADVDWSKDSENRLSSLIGDFPNRENKDWFITRTIRTNTKITWAEAARWLVYIQQYDGAGLHTGMKHKDGSTISGTSAAATWLGKHDGIFIEKSTLFETLMWNLVPPDQIYGSWSALDRNKSADNDFPSWEVNESYDKEQAAKVSNAPAGIISLLTWQGRNVAFLGGERYVERVIVSGRLPKIDTDDCSIETMSSWRFYNGSYGAYKFDSSVPIWRGLDALIMQIANSKHVLYKSILRPKYQTAKVLEWARDLTDALGFKSSILTVRVVGIRFSDSGQGSIDNIVDDRVELPAEILGEENNELALVVRDALGLIDKAGSQVYSLVSQIARTQGLLPEDGKVRGENAKRTFYASADADFRHWLRSVSSRSDLNTWKVQLLVHARQVEENIAQTVPSAKILKIAKYIKWYRREINKLLNTTQAAEQEVR